MEKGDRAIKELMKIGKDAGPEALDQISKWVKDYVVIAQVKHTISPEAREQLDQRNDPYSIIQQSDMWVIRSLFSDVARMMAEKCAFGIKSKEDKGTEITGYAIGIRHTPEKKDG